MIRIVVVDDDAAVRHGLKMRLALSKEMSVVAEAGDGKSALRVIHQWMPDVVVMDIGLSMYDGIAVTKMIAAENLPVAIVVHSLHDDATTRAQAHAAGAFAFISKHEGIAALLQAIRFAAAQEEQACSTSSMREFYFRYYTAVETSRAHAEFCEYAYGRNLCQHGFATLEQIDYLMRALNLDVTKRVLDLGCGIGNITEHIADMTGAGMTGLDNVDCAIASARERTASKRAHIEFVVGDLSAPQLPSHSFDVLLAIDTIYFSDDYAATLKRWRALLRPGGQMAIFYSHGVNPQNPKATFDVRTLAPDHTPLADALKQCKLIFQTHDWTRQDYELALRKKTILEKLHAEFVREGNQFLYDNRLGETLGVLDAIESQMHARYLYLITVGE